MARVALDAMGGDDAPFIVIKGVDLIHIKYPHVHFLLHLLPTMN